MAAKEYRTQRRREYFRLRPLADELDRRRAVFQEELAHYGEYLDQNERQRSGEKRVRFRRHNSFRAGE